jgi:hypothetical protein
MKKEKYMKLISLKKLSLVLLLGSSLITLRSMACTQERIQNITENIHFYNSDAAIQVDLAIQNITELCDENLFFAGLDIGEKFEPYHPVQVRAAANVISTRANQMPSEMIRGLGIGLIRKISIFNGDTTLILADAVAILGESQSIYAKEFALELLEKKHGSYPTESQYIQNAVDRLKLQMGNSPSPILGSSIWAFHSQNQHCDYYSGPWGYYYPCQRYYTSVSDNFGNRLILNCGQEESGIQFRVKLGPNLRKQLYRSQIESVSFGTDKISQSMGAVYFIAQDNSIYVVEPISYELLSALRSDKRLRVNFRLNSGETNIQLDFTLKGSNRAVVQLSHACQ